MPTVAQIENAEPLTASQSVRLIAAVRSSEYYRENKASYPDLEATIKAMVNRRKTITGATNATPVVVTATAHGFSDGDAVTIQNVIGNTAANGVWIVDNPTTNTFELQGSVGNAAYVSGGEAVSLISQHLSAIAAALDEVGDGTVGLKGGSDGLVYSQVSDREQLIAEVLDLLFSAEQTGAVVAFGQRGVSCDCQ